MLQVEAPEGLQPPLRFEECRKVEGQRPLLPVGECRGAEALQLRLLCEECSGFVVLVGFEPYLRVEEWPGE